MNVSVVVCNYNNEAYLKECLVSLVNQVFDGSYEIILVDDCSTDQSLDVARFLESDKINIHELNENRGLSCARNYGISQAKGEYIIFVDSDDYVSPTYISDLYSGLSADKTKRVMATCNFTAVDEFGNFIKSEVISRSHVVSTVPLSMLLERTITTLVWDKIYISEILKNEHIEFMEGVKNEDIDFNARYLCHIDEVVFVEKELIFYRQNSKSITKKPDMRLISDMFIVMDSVCKTIDENFKSDEFRKSFYSSYVYFCILISLKRMRMMSCSFMQFLSNGFELCKMHNSFMLSNNFKWSMFSSLNSCQNIKQRLIVTTFGLLMLILRPLVK